MHTKRPEWIYDQILKIEKRSAEPAMIRLKEEKKAVYFQTLGREFSEFMDNYPKLFFRSADGCLNKTMTLMALKEMHKVQTGEKTFEESNHEAIGAAFNLMLRNLPEDLRNKVANTYTDLMETEKAETKQIIMEKIAAQNGQGITNDPAEEVSNNNENIVEHMREIKSAMSTLSSAPERMETVKMTVE